MKRLGVLLVVATACGGGGSDGSFPSTDCSTVSGTCVQIAGGNSAALLDEVNTLSAGATIVLGEGTFALNSQITIRQAGVHLVGQGIDTTTLDFGPATAQGNGIDVVGNDFRLEGLTVLDAPKDGVRVENSDGVVFRKVRVTWSTPGQSTNGAYGVYPVKSKHILIEDCRVEHASDAGIYVGQSQHAIVRNNLVTGNVAGLEIENTQYADVYGNTAENNSGGILVFDLPGNPIPGRDVRLRDNIIRNNNGVNFSTPGSTVSVIPSGTGTFAMASRRVEITGNTYENNKSYDISVVSGLVIEDDPSKWAVAQTALLGSWQDLGLMETAPDSGVFMNFRSENILVANNTHTGSGTMPALDDPMMIGLLLIVLYGATPVDDVLYDGIGESMFDAANLAGNSNDNHVCVGGNTGGSFGVLNLELQITNPGSPALKGVTGSFGPFGCTALDGGPVAPVVLP